MADQAGCEEVRLYSMLGIPVLSHDINLLSIQAVVTILAKGTVVVLVPKYCKLMMSDVFSCTSSVTDPLSLCME